MYLLLVCSAYICETWDMRYFGSLVCVLIDVAFFNREFFFDVSVTINIYPTSKPLVGGLIREDGLGVSLKGELETAKLPFDQQVG